VLGWIPEDYKDARGVICLLCPDDYWMSKKQACISGQHCYEIYIGFETSEKEMNAVV